MPFRIISALALWLLVSVAHAGTRHYYYTDPQGTVLAKADASGAILATYDYAPYGTAVASMSPAPNGPGYTGHVNDPDSGLVYMQARYYDPAVGRFLSADPIGPAPGNPFNFNRYSYANNNPIDNVDPDGRKVVAQNKRTSENILEFRKSSAIAEGQYQALNSSKYIWKVSERFAMQSHVEPDNLDDAKSSSQGGTGKGTGGTIVINRGTEQVEVSDKPGGTPRTVKITKGEAAAHEFAHAVQDDKGTGSGDPHVREHHAREVEDEYRQEQHLDGKRNNVEGN